MLATAEVSVPNGRQAMAAPVAAIVRCSDDVVAVSLLSNAGASPLHPTELRLERLVEIGFCTIDVTVDATTAADPKVAAMLTRIAGLLATTEGQLTIRTTASQLIG